MNRVSERVAHAKSGAEGIAAYSQVRNFAEKLQGVPFLLQGISGGIGRAVDVDLRDFEFHRLAFAGDSTSTPVAAMLLPVVTCFKISSGTMPASTTPCMLLKREPSFSSMKVMPFESRRERTQPRSVSEVPTGRVKACLTLTAC